MSNETPNAPIQSLRDGAVVAKLWEQQGQNGKFVSVTLGKTIQDKETGQYREVHSLAGSDILKGHALLLEAHREVGKWKAYYREQQRDQEQAQGQLPMESAPQPTAGAAQGLAAQRDEALARAKPVSQTPALSQEIGPER